MYQGLGLVMKSIGGLFTVRLDASEPPCPLDGMTVQARGRGALRRRGELLVGDRVRVSYTEASFTRNEQGEPVTAIDGSGIAVEEILPRRNALIRPPMANLDVLLVTAAAATPEPVPETLDKLLCIAEFNGIEPIVVITKCDVAPDVAERMAKVYRAAGFSVFPVINPTGEGVEELKIFLEQRQKGRIAAFSGASGVGKSTLLNRIFPNLQLETGDLSHRIERGKNTTRTVELYPLSADADCGFLADTPGFTMLDFERFDFFAKEDLVSTFREFGAYVGQCKYRKCTHTKEEGCAILGAVAEGKIPKTRHRSYVSLFSVLKEKHDWDK